jgi:hypothetical protein
MSAAQWEERFASWAQPPGQIEAERIERAITAVRKAMDKSPTLGNVTKVYVQGSYRNRVNVRQDSDVDIGVLYTGNTFLPDYPAGMTKEQFGNVDSSYTYEEFKNAVGQALVAHFGSAAVKRGNKAFDIHENTYRIDADVVPLFRHRRYNKDGTYWCGVELRPDSGPGIVNWPERLYDDPHWGQQHYERGVAKNEATNRTFKGAVRIVKKLQHRMEDEGIAAAKAVPGFLIECLVYNVPNNRFDDDTWDRVIQSVFARIRAATITPEGCADWEEASGWKWLFRGSPDEKRAQAFKFIDTAWDYVGVRPLATIL